MSLRRNTRERRKANHDIRHLSDRLDFSAIGHIDGSAIEDIRLFIELMPQVVFDLLLIQI